MRLATWFIVIVAAALMLTSCGYVSYQPQNINESIKVIEAAEGSGCTYFRGNARPYADVSFMTIHTYGKNAPKYLDCLQAVPPEARMYLFSPQ